MSRTSLTSYHYIPQARLKDADLEGGQMRRGIKPSVIQLKRVTVKHEIENPET
jgi:hypothetical protein